MKKVTGSTVPLENGAHRFLKPEPEPVKNLKFFFFLLFFTFFLGRGGLNRSFMQERQGEERRRGGGEGEEGGDLHAPYTLVR